MLDQAAGQDGLGVGFWMDEMGREVGPCICIPDAVCQTLDQQSFQKPNFHDEDVE